jgi:predicted nucleotidyltransferase
MAVQTKLDTKQLTEFCQRWQISKLALLNSVLSDDSPLDSDVHMLVAFVGNPHHYTSRHWIAMEQALADILKRNVHLIDWKAIERSPNTMRRAHTLESAQLIYTR